MNFNMSKLDFTDDLIETTNESNLNTNSKKQPPPPNAARSQEVSAPSLLSELHKEIERLETKIKVQQKQLFLLESENTRLNQEKNALFFQNKTSTETLNLLEQKNDQLSQQFDRTQSENEMLSARIQASEKLIQTQKIDLQRLSKFHLKIKNTIKPYIVNLKETLNRTKTQLDNQIKANIDLQHDHTELSKKLSQTTNDMERMKASFQVDRTSLIKTYEEQLHELACEIIEVRESESLAQKENQSLKKKLEFKHSLENENIRLKRELSDLTKKQSEMDIRLNSVHIDLNDRIAEIGNLKDRISQLDSKNSQQELALESTRKQLLTKIEELEKANLRIKMFEKLNTQLSMNA